MVIALLESDLLAAREELKQLRVDIKSACESREIQTQKLRDLTVHFNQYAKQNEKLRQELEFIRPMVPLIDQVKLNSLDDWHEDIGAVLWWSFPVEEPPYCGSPLDSDWPGYHTHWTSIVIPERPLTDRQA